MGRFLSRTSAFIVFALAFLIAAAQLAWAQASGGVEGVAKDSLNRPLAGVSVDLQAPDGGITAHAVTAEGGAFHFSGIAPAIYSLVGAKQGFQTATAVAVVTSGAVVKQNLTLAAQAALNLDVIAQQLNEARIAIEPRIGASTYTLNNQTIENMPGGENAPMNQVMLQAPGVTQDSLANSGFHIRNEHLNVQYRINGVALPEGVSFFGQSLSTRFANSMQLITGTLPAEYGLRTAGIIDIQTKSGLFEPGGSVGLYGGSYDTVNPSVEYGGSHDGYNYFASLDNLQSGHGLENPTPNYNAIHDDTLQTHGFAYLDKIIDASSKVSLIAGTFVGQFQIPDNPGQPVANSVSGSTNFDSGKLNEHQDEGSHFGVLSYLQSRQDFDAQISTFTKYSTLHFHPDIYGDLAFTGIAQDALRQSFANGVQADAAYKAISNHTIRAGAVMTGEKAWSDTNNSVEITGGTPPSGCTVSSTPCQIVDNHQKTGWTYSAYLQDEWQITPTVTLNYGGRFDVVDEYTQENQISPRLNAVWKATSDTTLHAGYARYFTPPPFELVSTATVGAFANSTAAFPTSQNSPVKAERSHYFDAGVEHEFLPGLKGGIDVYYKYARNLIDETQFGSPVVLTPFNYHVGFNKGVELTTSYDHGPFSFYGNLAIAQQKAEQITSAQANFSQADLNYIATHLVNTDHSQRMTASAGMSYLWLGTRYSIDIVAGTGVRCACSTGDNFNEGTVPSYEQVNLGVSHHFANVAGGPIDVRLDILNVLDETYLIREQTGVGIAGPQYGPRRTVFAGIRKEF
jgi:outer membrane receptor protein involved in Fe transport